MSIEQQLRKFAAERQAMQSALDDAERRAKTATETAVGLSEFIGWLSDEKDIDIDGLSKEFSAWIEEEE